MTIKAASCFVLIICVLNACLLALRAEDPVWQRVAAVEVAQPEKCGFVVSATPYRYNDQEIPTETLPANSPARAVLFGSKMEFYFAGVSPAARCQVRAAFLSDSDNRVQSIEVGEVMLEKRLTLPRHQCVTNAWEVPASAFADGNLEVTLTALAGPNAVVSALEVWSTDPAPLKSPPPP